MGYLEELMKRNSSLNSRVDTKESRKNIYNPTGIKYKGAYKKLEDTLLSQYNKPQNISHDPENFYKELESKLGLGGKNLPPPPPVFADNRNSSYEAPDSPALKPTFKTLWQRASEKYDDSKIPEKYAGFKKFIAPLGKTGSFIDELIGSKPFLNNINTTAGETVLGKGNLAPDATGYKYSRSTGNKVADFASSTVGNIAGLASTPIDFSGKGTLAGNNLLNFSDDIAEYGARKIATKLPPLPLPQALKNIGTATMRGAIDGGIGDVANAMRFEENPQEITKQGLQGALGGALMFGTGKAIGEGTNAIRKGLDLPKINSMDFRVETQRKIDNPPKYELPGPPKIDNSYDSVLERSKQIDNPNKGIIDLPQIPNKLKAINEDLNIPSIPNFNNIKKESKLYKTLNNADFINPVVKTEIKDISEKLYSPINNKETWHNAQQSVMNNFENILTEISTKKDFNSPEDVAKSFALIDELQKRGDYKSAAMIAEDMIPKSRKLGQAVQAHAIVGRLSPEGVLHYATKQYEKVNQNLPPNKKIRITEGQIKNLRETAEVIQAMPEGRQREIAQAQLLNEIAKPIPKTLASKISSVQAMSHLLNVQTAMRNLFGNAAFNVAENISNIYAITFDKKISKKTGERTLTMPKLNPFTKGFKEGWKNAAEEIKLGIDLSGNSKYNLNQGNTFNQKVIMNSDPVLTRIMKKGNNVLARGENTLNYILKVPDEAFKKGIFEESLKNQMRASGLKSPASKMIEQAKQEALYRTFQDNSLPAQIFQGIKDVANIVGLGNKRKIGNINTHEFGLGDLIIKYTRVPGNIISRTVEYSPLGYLKALNVMHQSKIKGLNQRELSMTLGRATNGTFMIGMGVLLNRLGLLQSEDKNIDKDQRALDRSEGLGNYKVNISALNRLITNGKFEKENLKAGDILASYNWIQPVSTAFSIGASIDNEIRKSNTDKLIINSGATALEEMLDIPTLTIIQQMFYESQKKDSNIFTIAAVPIAESIPGFMPSQMRQISRAIDPISREVKANTSAGTLGNKLLNNTPLSRTLKPRVSPLGGEIRNDINPLLKMLNPANITKYNPSPSSEKLKEFSQYIDSKEIYPNNVAPNKITVNKKEYILSQEDKNKYQQIAGDELRRGYDSILGGENANDMSDYKRKMLVEKLKKVNLLAREKAKKEVLSDIKLSRDK